MNMSDLISRQAAIKALCKAVHREDETIPCPNQTVSCLWEKTRVCDYAREIYKVSSPWNPCSERLPEKDDRYLVTLENGYIEILGYSNIPTTRHPKGFYYVDEKGFAWKQDINPVVAWMPLPKAYDGEDR